MAAVCMARHSHCFFLSLSGGTYGTPKGKKNGKLIHGNSFFYDVSLEIPWILLIPLQYL